MSPTSDVVVVGGGIVGTATARELARSHPELSIRLLDKETVLARHQSGHNSGVIHSGIYYTPGSLKADLCRRGAEQTKQFAAEHDVQVVECGKLLVATTPVEVNRMTDLRSRAVQNGIAFEDVGREELKVLEPNVEGLAALLIPSAAITDYRAMTGALAAAAADLGVQQDRGVEVFGIEERPNLVTLHTREETIRAKAVVFCAGVQSDRLARMSGIDTDFAILPFRGECYDVAPEKAGLVERLIYPIPDPELPFLGVHLTPTTAGGLTVGPNAVLGLAREKYRKGSVAWRDVKELVTFAGTWRAAGSNLATGVREVRNSVWKAGYLKQCRKYCPSLELSDLRPREAGIRAQAVMRDGTFVHDFLLRRTARTLHVVNAPSPAATSALPIAERVANMLTSLMSE